ncbi:LytR family transcriptional regulator [Actinomadura darangshiensis]|uniref:LytR family transcriptional regulator n=1 Tax=Actinomadura darangshiensis TaxID=705336 RepID=A0A4R5ATU0_9ACTN|nr:LCP family protein [Actinomadura darangshiensis]TDD75815.1 LytR family transcriptional regulator [Actinomadura darangshiensis]
MKLLGWVAVAMAAVVVTGSLSAYGYYWKLQSAVHHEDVDALLGKNRPKKLNSALNILVLGSDTRDGANAQYGHGLKGKPPASDTMVMLHLSPGGGQAVAVSFPRDLMVPIPECTKKDGTKVPGSSIAMLNEAMAHAGPTCTINTIEQVTKIHIDHFVQVDFVGFKRIATAVGGVPVCVTADVHDKDSGLNLTKGRHRLKGEDALAYVRSRKGFGNGSDTERIKRQQHFFGALAKEAMGRGVLTDPGRLNELLRATAESMTTDKKLTVAEMLKIAQGMRDLNAGKLRFVTAPSGAYARNKNRVALTQPAADRFFKALREDVTVPAPAKASSAQPGKVRVYNASGVDGRAAQVATQLKDGGWQVTGVGNLTSRTQATYVRYGTGAAPQARALAKLLPGAKVAPRAKTPAGAVDLVIGTAFTSVRTSGVPVQRGESRASDTVCEKVA